MLPNFICPGAARSATTALCYLLIQHPQIYLPSIKETRFFAQDYSNGVSWYEKKYYGKVKDERAIGDISPIYLLHEQCPERICHTLGKDVKFVFMLRNPVDRAYSHYCMLKNHRFEDLPFKEAIFLEEKRRIAKSKQHYGHEYGFQYLKGSSYSQHIQRYLQYFAKDQMKFVIFSEFIQDVAKHLADIVDFLAVEGQYGFDYHVYTNQRTTSRSSRLSQVFYGSPLAKKLRDAIQLNTKWKTQSILKKVKNTILTRSHAPMPPISAELQKDLDDYFQKEIVRLETLLGRELSIWKRN